MLNSQFLIYKDDLGQIKIDVRFDNETVWLSQKMIAELFGTTVPNVLMHIKNIFTEWELLSDSTIKNFLTVQKEGNREVSRKLDYYNLDVIIAVWYRINSKQATHFRIRATQKLKEYIIKWFVIDEERLKNPDLPFDYFEDLVQKIQDIRTSEKRFYRKITDIYATSIDYDPTEQMSIDFFQTVQNKVHFAITWKTAAEIIYDRVDSKKENLWLTNRRSDRVRKNDIAIAKNYLDEKELEQLNNLIEQYLIFAIWQAKRRIPMKMEDRIEKLDWFLNLNNREILNTKWWISHTTAIEKAESEYEKFNTKKINEYSNVDKDFDDVVEKILPKK